MTSLLNVRVVTLGVPVTFVLSVWARVKQEELLVTPENELGEALRLLEKPPVVLHPGPLVGVCQLSCQTDPVRIKVQGHPENSPH